MLSKVSFGSNEVAEELKSRLQLKERLFQELLSDRGRQTHEHHQQVQDLLDTINAREQYIKVTLHHNYMHCKSKATSYEIHIIYI